jgi:hypothetical protein
MTDQLGLFGSATLPDGFRYQPDLISVAEERQLLDQIRQLPFKAFEFQGYTGKRRVVSYGWKYDFNERRLEPRDDILPFLLPLREKAARFAEIAPEDLQQALVTEYDVGAPIGWHKDKAVFGDVIGISGGAMRDTEYTVCSTEPTSYGFYWSCTDCVWYPDRNLNSLAGGIYGMNAQPGSRPNQFYKIFRHP